MDAATMLKPVLTTGRVQVIGATTAEDYRRYIAKDAALERRFQPIQVAEPSVDEAIAILRGLRGRYEMHHGVRISDEAIVSAVELSARYVTDRFLPDKAVDLVDRAGARVRLREKSPMPPDPVLLEQRVRRLEREKGAAQGEDAVFLAAELDRAVAELEAARAALADAPQVVANDVAEIVSRSTGIPVAQLTEAERHRLLHLEDHLHQRIVGQDEAVEAVADAVRQGRAGLKHPHRPVGSFLFLGPTGVGKTEIARALAEALFGSEDRLIRFDMSEFSQAHAVTRLIGVPPGYAGYEDAGQLTGAVRRAPYSVLLLDEIEKAHSDVFNTLLQVLDAGRLTDAERTNRRLRQHRDHHDQQHRRRPAARRGHLGCPGRAAAGAVDGDGPPSFPPGVPQPPRRDHPVPRTGRRPAAADHRAAARTHPPTAARTEHHAGRGRHRPSTGSPPAATSPSTAPGRCAAPSAGSSTVGCPAHCSRANCAADSTSSSRSPTQI